MTRLLERITIHPTDRKRIFYLFLLAFFIRLAYVMFFWHDGISGDAVDYDSLATGILSGKGFFAFGSYSYRAPLYPLFLAAVYFIFGHNYFAVYLVQALIGAATCVLIYYFAIFLTKDSKTASVSAFIGAVYYGLLEMPPTLLTETLFTFLFLLSLVLLVRPDGVKWRNAAASGLVLGFATLTRGVTIIFPYFIFIYYLAVYKEEKKQAFRLFLINSLFFLLVLAPWTARNYLRHRAFVPVNIQAGQVFWGSNNPWSGGSWVNIETLAETQPEAERCASMPELYKDRCYFANGMLFIKSITIGQFIKLELEKIFFFLFPSLDVFDVTFAIVAPFAFIGLLFLGREVMLLNFVVLLFLIQTLIFHGSSRYRGPLSPAIIILSVMGAKYMRAQFINKKYFWYGVYAWLFVNGLIFIIKLGGVSFGIM